jgi:hypothetical protein
MHVQSLPIHGQDELSEFMKKTWINLIKSYVYHQPFSLIYSFDPNRADSFLPVILDMVLSFADTNVKMVLYTDQKLYHVKGNIDIQKTKDYLKGQKSMMITLFGFFTSNALPENIESFSDLKTLAAFDDRLSTDLICFDDYETMTVNASPEHFVFAFVN